MAISAPKRITDPAGSRTKFAEIACWKWAHGLGELCPVEIQARRGDGHPFFPAGSTVLDAVAMAVLELTDGSLVAHGVEPVSFAVQAWRSNGRSGRGALRSRRTRSDEALLSSPLPAPRIPKPRRGTLVTEPVIHCRKTWGEGDGHRLLPTGSTLASTVRSTGAWRTADLRAAGVHCHPPRGLRLANCQHRNDGHAAKQPDGQQP